MSPLDDRPQEDITFHFEQRRIRQPRAIKLFRVVIWLTPGPAWILLLGLLQMIHLPILIHPIVGIFLTSAGTAFVIGLADALIAPEVERKAGQPDPVSCAKHAVKFTLIQIIVAPISIMLFIYIPALVMHFFVRV